MANIGLVLGLACLIAPITIASSRFKREYPPFLLSALLILFLAWDLKIHRLEGIVMVGFLTIYIWRSFNYKEDLNTQSEEEVRFFSDKGPTFQVLLIRDRPNWFGIRSKASCIRWGFHCEKLRHWRMVYRDHCSRNRNKPSRNRFLHNGR